MENTDMFKFDFDAPIEEDTLKITPQDLDRYFNKWDKIDRCFDRFEKQRNLDQKEITRIHKMKLKEFKKSLRQSQPMGYNGLGPVSKKDAQLEYNKQASVNQWRTLRKRKFKIVDDKKGEGKEGRDGSKESSKFSAGSGERRKEPIGSKWERNHLNQAQINEFKNQV